MARSAALRVVAVLVVVALPVLLVLPFHPEAGLYGDVLRASPWWARPLAWATVEWGGNVLAFAVFAVALSAFTRPLVAFAIGCGTSAALEAAQLAIPHRVASPGDLALNCTGALLGAAVVVLVERAAQRRRAASARRTDRIEAA